MQNINAKTNLYCIIGNPVKHSLSPILHNAAFNHLNINAVYLAFQVNNLKNAIIAIKELNIKGVSVTIPFKEDVIPLLDEIDEASKEIGAVNTILNEGNLLRGFNTDYIGAIKALEEHTDLNNKRAVVLGAGGSAKAICYALKLKGANLHIANRTVEKAKSLASKFNATFSNLDHKDIYGDILINTTSVGLKGTPDADKTPLPTEYICRFKLVMDIVYSPLETPLLQTAKKLGLTTIDGLKMLIYQGAKQFEIWTGINPPIEVMTKAVYNEIAP